MIREGLTGYFLGEETGFTGYKAILAKNKDISQGTDRNPRWFHSKIPRGDDRLVTCSGSAAQRPSDAFTSIDTASSLLEQLAMCLLT